MSPSVPAVPPVLRLLWGLTEASRRGPKPGLTLDAIAQAGIALADEQGLAGVSMSRVAERLGVTAMALYRYVASKDDLLVVMMDAATGPPDYSPGPGWRDGLAAWCREYRTVMMAHSWILQIPITGPPAAPNQLAWMEAGLAAMAETRLSGTEQTQVLIQLSGYVRGDAQLNADLQAAAGPAADEDEQLTASWAAVLSQVIEEDRFPHLMRLITAGEFEQDDDPLEQFEFGLQRMLDGIAVLVQRRADRAH